MLTLRAMSEADLTSLQAWFADAQLASRLSMPSDAWLRHVRGPHSACWLACSADAAAVGFVQVDRSARGNGYLAFAIDPDQRGAGLGQAMLQQFLSEHGGRYERLHASVEPDNRASVQCLLRCGFVSTGRRDAEGCVVLSWSRRASAR